MDSQTEGPRSGAASLCSNQLLWQRGTEAAIQDHTQHTPDAAIQDHSGTQRTPAARDMTLDSQPNLAIIHCQSDSEGEAYDCKVVKASAPLLEHSSDEHDDNEHKESSVDISVTGDQHIPGASFKGRPRLHVTGDPHIPGASSKGRPRLPEPLSESESELESTDTQQPSPHNPSKQPCCMRGSNGLCPEQPEVDSNTGDSISSHTPHTDTQLSQLWQEQEAGGRVDQEYHVDQDAGKVPKLTLTRVGSTLRIRRQQVKESTPDSGTSDSSQRGRRQQVKEGTPDSGTSDSSQRGRRQHVKERTPDSGTSDSSQRGRRQQSRPGRPRKKETEDENASGEKFSNKSKYDTNAAKNKRKSKAPKHLEVHPTESEDVRAKNKRKSVTPKRMKVEDSESEEDLPEDVALFQCRKCKKRFSAIGRLVNHVNSDNCKARSMALALAPIKTGSTCSIDNVKPDPSDISMDDGNNDDDLPIEEDFWSTRQAAVSIFNTDKPQQLPVFPQPKVELLDEDVEDDAVQDLAYDDTSMDPVEAEPPGRGRRTKQQAINRIRQHSQSPSDPEDDLDAKPADDDYVAPTGKKRKKSSGKQTPGKPAKPSGKPAKAPGKPASNRKQAKTPENPGSQRKRKEWNCEKCDVTFRGQTALYKHIREVHDDVESGEMLCPECGEAFSNKLQYKRHVKAHGKKKFVCEFCDFVCPSQQRLEMHRYKHTGERPFKCDVCEATYIHPTDLRRHKQTHTGEKPYMCEVCPSCFNRRQGLVEHMRSHTGEKPYACGMCHMSFAYRNDRKRHLRTHTGEKPYKCDQCAAAFKQRSNLRAHVRGRHTGEKPFSCNYCGMSFSRSNVLKTHKRVHTDERPYQCHVCSARFRQLGNLTSHLLTHSSEKPHVCVVCNTGFRLVANLQQHMRVHTGEKPYKCPQCDATFGYSNVLKTHLRTHTGQKPYKCRQCPAAFTKNSYLQRHKKNVHDTPPIDNFDPLPYDEDEAVLKSLPVLDSHQQFQPKHEDLSPPHHAHRVEAGDPSYRGPPQRLEAGNPSHRGSGGPIHRVEASDPLHRGSGGPIHRGQTDGPPPVHKVEARVEADTLAMKHPSATIPLPIPFPGFDPRLALVDPDLPYPNPNFVPGNLRPVPYPGPAGPPSYM